MKNTGLLLSGILAGIHAMSAFLPSAPLSAQERLPPPPVPGAPPAAPAAGAPQVAPARANRGQEPPTFEDVARFVSGVALRPDSPLQGLVGQPAVIKHYQKTQEMSTKWEDSRLVKIREWSKKEIHPRISRPGVMKYMFGGPDLVHAATMFPGVAEYVLVGLEPLGTLPNFPSMDTPTLDAYLGQLNYTLRSISKRSFFITKEMREDFGKLGVDGVYPVLLYFANLTGHEVLDGHYVKLSTNGQPVECSAGEADGIRLGLRLVDASPSAPSTITAYYFKTDLSNGGFRAGSPFFHFLKARSGGVAYLKAASFLMHTGDFTNIRNFLVGETDYILQDASGIPADFLAQYFDVTYYGNYVGPIDMFSEYDQPFLHQVYRSGAAKPLPFGTGYRMRDEDAIQLFGIKKR